LRELIKLYQVIYFKAKQNYPLTNYNNSLIPKKLFLNNLPQPPATNNASQRQVRNANVLSFLLLSYALQFAAGNNLAIINLVKKLGRNIDKALVKVKM
jgi:hypothetical protein